MVAISDFSTFSQMTGMRSEYFWRMRSASALRFSKGCSSLNFDRILTDLYDYFKGCGVARSVVDVVKVGSRLLCGGC